MSNWKSMTGEDRRTARNAHVESELRRLASEQKVSQEISSSQRIGRCDREQFTVVTDGVVRRRKK